MEEKEIVDSSWLIPFGEAALRSALADSKGEIEVRKVESK